MKKRLIFLAIIAVFLLAMILISMAAHPVQIEQASFGGASRAVGEGVEVTEITGGHCGEPELISLGEFEITYYCPGYDGVGFITATGVEVFAGLVAVDPSVIPLHSEVIIDGEYFLAEDVGGVIQGNRIDIFVWDYETAVQGGRQFREVWVKA
jgi:3D (Asp-Asp-Asp) domain-containing protein